MSAIGAKPAAGAAVDTTAMVVGIVMTGNPFETGAGFETI